MQTMDSRPSFLSFRAPLSCRAWLGHGAAASLIFVVALTAMQISLAAFLPPWMGPLFAMIFLVVALIASSASPMVVLIFILGYQAAAYGLEGARIPDCSSAIGAPLAIFFALVALVFCLRLIALAVRRRHDAGAMSSWVLFVFFLLYGALFCLSVEHDMAGDDAEEPVILWGISALLIFLHVILFLRPTRLLPAAPCESGEDKSE